jgi:dihydrofolate reductase
MKHASITRGRGPGFKLAYKLAWLLLLLSVIGACLQVVGMGLGLFLADSPAAWVAAAARASQMALWAGYVAGLVGMLLLIGLLTLACRHQAQHKPVASSQWVAIAAMAENRAIGNAGALPWHLPEDFEHFKRTTMGHVLLMGRKTWESIGQKPLPGREHWVISRSLESADQARVFASLEAALAEKTDKTVFIAGGQEVYAQALPYCEAVILTQVKGQYDGDSFMPSFEAQFPKKERLQQTADFAIDRYTRS